MKIGMMKTWVLSALMVLAGTGMAFGMSFDVEGSSTSGLNDTTATAQDIGTILGGPLGLFFDIDFASDIGATSDDDEGLDPALWIFNSTGLLLASNDDSHFFMIGAFNAGTDPGSDPFADHDPFIGELVLTPGMYFAAVAFYSNNASAEDQGSAVKTFLSVSGFSWSGVTPDSSFDLDVICDDITDPKEQCTGQYRLQIRTTFADTTPQLTVMGYIDENNENDVDFYKFTIGTNDSTNPIPEPSTILLLGSGLVGLIGYRLKKTA